MNLSGHDVANMLIPALIAFSLSAVCSLIYGPIVRRLALRVGLVDHPDHNRKMQKGAIALGGGVILLLSLLTAAAALLLLSPAFGLAYRVDWQDLTGFSLACTTVVLVGLFDDRFGLRGRHKLVGQMIAAGFLIWTGLTVTRIGVFGANVELGRLSIPFTMFWLLGAMNAINLLDGLDGLASVIGIILAVTIAFLAALNSHFGITLIALVLAGSLTGFLRLNFPPAKMYLGDAGSMLIGLLVGALAIKAMLKGPGTVLLAAPLAICGIPILDSAAAILRRKLTGRSLFATDRGHLHHRLLERLGSNTAVLFVVGACCLATSAGALLSVMAKNDLFAVISCFGVAIVFVATGLFGRAELKLLLNRLGNLGASFAHPTDIGGGRVRKSSVHLQGDKKWEILWETVTESAGKLSLVKMHLDVNAPALHESYVATWEHPDAKRQTERCWCLLLPLSVGPIQVGQLDVRGRRNGGTGLEEISQLLDLLEPFQARLADMTRRDDVEVPVLTE